MWSRPVTGIICLLCLQTVFAADWDLEINKRFGFAMLKPKGMVLKERKSGDWTALYGKQKEEEFFLLHKPTEAMKLEKMFAFAARQWKVSREHWELMDEARDEKGWRWRKAFVIRHQNTFRIAGFGVGPKGSYIVVLKVPEDVFEEHKEAFQTWFTSIALFGWKPEAFHLMGLRLEIPKGLTLKMFEPTQNWRGLHGQQEGGLETTILYRKGEHMSSSQTHHLAKKAWKVDLGRWSPVDKGEHEYGWEWYEVYRAVQGKNGWVAVVGAGQKGTYLLFLRLPREQFDRNEQVLMYWLHTIRLMD